MKIIYRLIAGVLVAFLKTAVAIGGNLMQESTRLEIADVVGEYDRKIKAGGKHE